MRTKKVTRHYCDFCNRGGFKRKLMESHERSCCKNPNRRCYLCKSERMVLELVNIWSRDGFDALQKDVDYCPACILAALLQGKEGTDEAHYDWDYKEALREWHAERDLEHCCAFEPVFSGPVL